MPTDKNLLRRAWEGLLENLNVNVAAESERIERAIGMSRLYEQLWDALGNSEQSAAGWTYPLDIFVGDDGSSLFSIVAQNGKLFQVPLTVTQETLTLGEWTQVTEVFQPVTQSRFSITRQKDGSHRWLCIASTTVLNRVGEMDSSELFGSFIQHAEKTKKYPRLDFYHLGESNPRVWEFGTADYLARDGVCYIASGTFDEEHLLTKAFIDVCKRGSTEWGNSIEFYAYTEPEIIVVDPEVQVPVYREGENTRISVVLEKDAACLFTRMVEITEEKVRTMDPRVEEALKKLFADDEEKVSAFIASSDAVNQTVKNDKLIHRKKKDVVAVAVAEAEAEDDAEDTEEEDESEEDAPVGNIDLDDEGLKDLAQQLIDKGALAPILQSVADLAAMVSELKVGHEAIVQENTKLKKANTQLAQKIEALSVDDTEKKTQYLQDLPARKRTPVTYRKRGDEEEADEEAEESYEQRAKTTLSKLPTY